MYVGLQNVSYFMMSFWSLEFLGASYIFGNVCTLSAFIFNLCYKIKARYHTLYYLVPWRRVVIVFYLPKRSLYALNALTVVLEEERIQQWEEYNMALQNTHVGTEKVSELI
jgi:hypothetical protein